ncbi:hypothetical protein NT6N_30590 [Oceaniferula spumae]|uniref:DUF2059 domain-containing protein n=1 Tax=Oceaniferula spumae TaxID=2979115 RepID=A0AAT9FPU5_9BACT
MKTLILCIFAIASFSSAFGQIADEESSPALQLMKLIKLEQTMNDASKAAFSPYLNQLREQGIPEAGVKEVSDAADVYFNQVATDPDLKAEMVKLYEKEFSKEELLELVAFYKSPIGQKSLDVMPALMNTGAKLGEKYAQKYAGNFKVELQRIMKKYQDDEEQP